MRHICWRFYDITDVHEIQHIKRMEVEKKLPKKWTGLLVGLMHEHNITQANLADELGVTREYVSMVLRGHREPAKAEKRFTEAVNRMVENKAKENA